MGDQRSSNFMAEFPGRRNSKTYKKTEFSCLKEGIESDLGFIAFTTFSIINYRCRIMDCLESHLFSNHYKSLETQLCANQRQGFGFHPAATSFNSFTSVFHIPENKSSLTKAPAIDYFL